MTLFEKKFEPMLLSETKEAFNSKDYLFEIKFDGIRALIFVSPTKFKIYNRHQGDITEKYPELKEIQKMVTEPTIFDGEIVSFENGLPSFSKLQERAHLKNKYRIERMSQEEPVMYVAFDVLYEGKDLTKYSLLKRKRYLDKYRDNDVFLKPFWVDTNGISLFKKIKKLNMEGIVAKRKESPYEINTRSEDWIKIKNIQREEFVIGGFTEKEGTPFFSLCLGEYLDGVLTYVGKVSAPKKNELYQKMQKEKIRKTSPFDKTLSDDITYVTPKHICFVEFIERSKEGILRQPVFRGEK